MMHREYRSYLDDTEPCETLSSYISMNMDGLDEKIRRLLSGEHVRTDVSGFANDMTTFRSCDDVLTLLVHLGYLGYDRETGTVCIPNTEQFHEFSRAVRCRP